MSSQLRLSAYSALATMATATALTSVFSSWSWLVPVMGAILIVSASCALVRYSPLPSAFEPITAAVAILLWVTFLDARSKAHFGFVPGRLAFRHLGHVARHGFAQIRRLPTPAPPHHGLVLLTVVGVAAVALVVDLMTVTLRRAALSGLPLLGLFTVCAATGHHGVGIVPFIAGAIGYLWLLFADNREKVARWGAAVGTGSRARPASAWSTDVSSAPAPASLGRQVGAAAITLGVLIPLAIPGLHTGIDKHGNGPGSGSGSGNVTTFNPIVKVGADLNTSTPVPVIDYKSSTPNPGYLRLTSLDLFNGTTFSSPTLEAPASESASENLPVNPPAGPVVTSSISVSPQLSLNWLPVQATAIGVSVGKAWRYDPATATVFSATTTTKDLRYSTRTIANQPTPSELESAGRADAALTADMTVPRSISPAVRELTRQVTAHAATRYDAALDIQRFFTDDSRFTYDTRVPADNSPDALAHFLLQTRRGFCQQFATAMAVMARLSGIPARVAVGFTRGTQQPDGSWLVTTHDAHAWPELWFQGFGWLAFEPTPRGDGQAVTPGYASVKPNSTPKLGPKTKQQPTPNQSTSVRPPRGVNGGGFEDANGSAHSHSGGLAGWMILVLVLVVGGGLVSPAVARVITRRRRWRQIGDPVLGPAAAWAELRDSAIDLRVPWDDGWTPRQTATILGRALGPAAGSAASIRRLAHCEEQSRYALTPDIGDADLRHEVVVVRSAARATRTRRQRTFAWLMPRSTLLVVRAWLARVGAQFDRLSRFGASVRRHARPRLRSRLSG